jgi:hypothetical protein
MLGDKITQNDGASSFVFPSGDKAHNIEELVRLCEQYSEDAIYFLKREDFEKWLVSAGRNQLAQEAAKVRQNNLLDDEHQLKGFILVCNNTINTELKISKKIQQEHLSKDSIMSDLLQKRDYTLIVDKSASMSDIDQKGGKSRWEVMQESTLALARKCEQFDPDGITVYTFSNRFKRYNNVTASKVAQIFKESEPIGRTNLAEVLQDALNNYFQRKTSGETKSNGETIVVVTDGVPDDSEAVMKAIIEASRQMERDEELGISFIQIGNDPEATRFLKLLDDQLKSKNEGDGGAKFDIVDVVTLEEIENEQFTLQEVLLNAIID